MNFASLKRRLWFRLAMRGSGQNDPYRQIDRLYFIRDPWNIDSPGELARLAGTNAAIEKAFGRVGTMLEVGCGEGVQSAHLAKLCDRLTGIDVSGRAIKRARRRVPTAEFAVGDLASQAWAGDAGKFDLVVAAEVLNYMSDPKGFIDSITRLSRTGCLITYFAMNDAKLGPVVREIPGVQIDTITFGDRGEKKSFVAWWRGVSTG